MPRNTFSQCCSCYPVRECLSPPCHRECETAQIDALHSLGISRFAQSIKGEQSVSSLRVQAHYNVIDPLNPTALRVGRKAPSLLTPAASTPRLDCTVAEPSRDCRHSRARTLGAGCHPTAVATDRLFLRVVAWDIVGEVRALQGRATSERACSNHQSGKAMLLVMQARLCTSCGVDRVRRIEGLSSAEGRVRSSGQEGTVV